VKGKCRENQASNMKKKKEQKMKERKGEKEERTDRYETEAQNFEIVIKR